MILLPARFSSAAGLRPPGTGIPKPILTGNPTLVGSWDFDNLSLLTMTTGIISKAAPADGISAIYEVAAAGTNRPTSVLRTDRYAVRFAKAFSQYLRVLNGLGLDGSGVTMVVIYEPVTTTDHAFLMAIGDSTSGSFDKHYVSAELTHGWSYQKYDAAGAQAIAATETPYGGAGTRNLLIGATSYLANQSAVAWLNGAATLLTQTGTSNAPSVCNSVTLGAFSVGNGLSYFADGYLYRAFAYSTPFTATNAEEMAAYSALNYGTPNLA